MQLPQASLSSTLGARAGFGSRIAEAFDLRRWRDIVLLGAMAGLLGLLVGTQPSLAVAAVALVIVTLLAFYAPVTHLSILLALTAIVPYSIANKYSGGGGTGHAGLLASDLFLLTGLLRTALYLPS